MFSAARHVFSYLDAPTLILFGVIQLRQTWINNISLTHLLIRLYIYLLKSRNLSALVLQSTKSAFQNKPLSTPHDLQLYGNPC